MAERHATRRRAQAAAMVVAASVSVNLGAAMAKGLFTLVGPEGVVAIGTAFACLFTLPLGLA